MANPAVEKDAGVRLSSWKEIAVHLGRSVRTVQRWEKQQGLPVYRLELNQRGAIYAYTGELDAWWDARSGRLTRLRRMDRRMLWMIVAVMAIAVFVLMVGFAMKVLPASTWYI